MSEPVKIAEDLQEMYKATKLGTIMFAVGSQIRELIERASAAEAALALAKEEIAALEAKCPAHEFCLDSDDAIRRRGVIAAEVSALREERDMFEDALFTANRHVAENVQRCEELEEENARLKAPVSDEEWYGVGVRSNICSERAKFDAIIAARSKAPDGAQEAEGARDE